MRIINPETEDIAFEDSVGDIVDNVGAKVGVGVWMTVIVAADTGMIASLVTEDNVGIPLKLSALLKLVDATAAIKLLEVTL